jgi:hypothetical protein
MVAMQCTSAVHILILEDLLGCNAMYYCKELHSTGFLYYWKKTAFCIVMPFIIGRIFGVGLYGL